MTYSLVHSVPKKHRKGLGFVGLGATTYVIPSGGTFTGMFNVRGLGSGTASAASSAIGVEVRSIRGVTFTNVGWGSGRDAGVVVAQGIVNSDTVPGVLLGKLREAAVRAKARIPGSVVIDTTIRHVPTVARESTPSPDSLIPSIPTVSEPFTVLGIPLWLVGVIGVGVVVGGVVLLKKKAQAPAATSALTANRRIRRNPLHGPFTKAEELLIRYDSKIGTVAHNRSFSLIDARDYGIPEKHIKRWLRAGLIKRSGHGKYFPTSRGWKVIERDFD